MFSFFLFSDRQIPRISGCPTDGTIQVNRYSRVQPSLPSLLASDNTDIKTFTVAPRNANSTLIVSTSATNIVYAVTDFEGNTETCSLTVNIIGKLF